MSAGSFLFVLTGCTLGAAVGAASFGKKGGFAGAASAGLGALVGGMVGGTADVLLNGLFAYKSPQNESTTDLVGRSGMLAGNTKVGASLKHKAWPVSPGLGVYSWDWPYGHGEAGTWLDVFTRRMLTSTKKVLTPASFASLKKGVRVRFPIPKAALMVKGGGQDLSLGMPPVMIEGYGGGWWKYMLDESLKYA